MRILAEIVVSGLARLRTRNPIAAVAAEYGVILEPRGRVLVGCCPLERRPSPEPTFTVWPALGRFECCECGQRGDVIGFVIWAERLNFVNAVQLLCRRAGMAESEVLRFSSVVTKPEPPRPLLLGEHPRQSEVPAWALTPLPGELLQAEAR
jgi:hypothetical protein